ncbi:hypothetical protein FQR65_LT13375 [Abscondita terminalis]|nr:hypothetical protein FQR65_LT13375 [Abscondita terminalis]
MICKVNCVLTVEDENIELYKCVNRVIETIFKEEETLLFSISDGVNFVFSNTITNPRLIFSEKNLLKYENEVGFQMGIVLYVDALENSKRIERIWFSKLVENNINPNVKWFIITPSPNVASYFSQLWYKDVLHIVVLMYNSNSANGLLQLFTADPQAIPNKCGAALNLVNNQTCNSNIVVKFPKPLRKYTNCTLKFMTSTELMKEETQNNHAVTIIHNFLIKQISSQLDSNYARHSGTDRSMIIALTILRYENTGILRSTIFYSAKAMWAVPKPKLIPLIKVIGIIFNKTVWTTIVLSFIVTATIWWLIVKYAKEYVKDNCSFTVILLNTWELTLFGCVNRIPVLWATRLLVIGYIICFIHIQAIFNSKVVEVLTVPQYEHGIRNLEELLDSGLEILVHPYVKYLVFVNSSNDGDVRYNKALQLLRELEDVEEITEVISEEPYLNDNVLGISNIINDNSLTGNFDAIVFYPGGSYVSLTVNRIVDALVESGIMNDLIKKLQMTKLNFESDTQKPLTIDNLYAVFIFLVEYESNELYNCVNRVIETIFKEEETILFSISDGVNFVLSNTIANPRLIFLEKNLLKHKIEVGFRMGIVLYVDALENSKRIDRLWYATLVINNISSNVKWFIITPRSDIASYFKQLWLRDVLHIVVLLYNSNSANGFLQLFTADPQAIPNKCGTVLNLVNNQTCDSNIVVEYPKPLRKYTNCTFKIMTSTELMKDKTQNNHTVKIIHNFLIKQISSQLDSNYVRYSRTDRNMIIFLTILRYGDKGILSSTIFYSTKAMWAVPKPKLIPLIRVIGIIFNKTVWATILLSFIVTATIWWLIVKYAKEYVKDKCSFTMILLNTWELTLFGCVNRIPVLWATRLLVIGYIICFIHIQAIFNSKVVEVLTVPQYEHGIQNLEELLYSGLEVIVHPYVQYLVFTNTSNDGDVRYNKALQIISKLDDVEEITDVLSECIMNSECAAFFTGEEPYLNDGVLGISNIINDNSLTGNFDVIVGYPGGSYISLTVNRIVDALVESGIMNDFTKKLQMTKLNYESDTKKPLTIDNLYAVFIFLVMGFGISAICFICESVAQHYNDLKIFFRKRRNNK